MEGRFTQSLIRVFRSVFLVIIIAFSALHASGQITGPSTVCAGSSITLSDATSGGTWTSSVPAIASIGSSSGILDGVSPGIVTISYTLPSSTVETYMITVNTTPAAISGPGTVCASSTITLSDVTSGGTWSSASSLVSVGSANGVVTGVSNGTATITYSLSTGCAAFKVITVNTMPAAILGSPYLCPSSSNTLSNTTAGGTWASSNTVVATIGSSSGITTGGAVGTSTITYALPTGCKVFIEVTTNPMPGFIGGTTAVCDGSTTALSNTSAGGTWSSSNTFVGTADITSGIVGGISPGTTTITYALPTGCLRTTTVTVNPLPSPIFGTMGICPGTTAVLFDATAGGTWSSSNTAVATTSGGTVSGITAGTSTITYQLATGCKTYAEITVNPTPAAIAGTAAVCPGATSTLSSATSGGTWVSSNTSVATIDAAGIVTAIAPGTSTITYTVTSTGCRTTVGFTVFPPPAPITGNMNVCFGLTTTLSSSTPAGTWSSSSPTTASVGSGSGIVTGVAAGTALITYTISTGCIATDTVTVNPLPAAITGALEVCPGAASSLSSADAGGTWASSALSVASVGSSTGVVAGLAAGTSFITYTLPTTCKTTAIVTVNGIPNAITGTTSICPGGTSTLSSTTVGGVWSSTNPLIGTVDATSGIVTAIASGTTTISYADATTGCARTTTFTVLATPTPIAGIPQVCEGSVTTLSSTPTGGSWISTSSAITISLSGGIATGVAAGVASVTYTLGTGCYTTIDLTVYPLPPAITGTTAVCVGGTTTLSNSAPSGVWSTTGSAYASVDSFTGVVTGFLPGLINVTYTLPTGCYRATSVTINTLPAAITGPSVVCQGATIALGNSIGGGTWSSSMPSVATVGSGTGIVTGISGGVATITYTTANGCYITKNITVNALPAAITGTATVCSGSTTTLSSATSGGTWWSSNFSVATVGITSGVVTGLSVTTGVATITYTVAGCITTAPVTVNALPANITGTFTVCVGSSTTLGNATVSGTWSSSTPPGTATLSAAGVVTGVSAGTFSVSYVLSSGCMKSVVITVNPIPAAITGTPVVCQGSSITLSNPSAGGTWSGSAGVTVSAATGVVAGVIPGTSTVYYSFSTGCKVSTPVTINALPAGISGAAGVCIGSTTTLTNAVSGGVWNSSNTALATIDSFTGVATGVAMGSLVMTYTLNTTGCRRSMAFSVYSLPAAIVGLNKVCTDLSIGLSTASVGGAWSSSAPSIATVTASSGIVTGVAPGVATISYIMGTTGCRRTMDVTVNPTPAPITGTTTFCYGGTTTLSNDSVGGTWSSSATTVGSIGATTGIMVGTGFGTSTITYAMSSGCKRTIVVTVSPLPAAITGNTQVCLGLLTTLSNTVAGGTWSSSDTDVAAVPVFAGHVAGISIGSATITYTIGPGCIKTTNVTVNALPAAITGGLTICPGTATSLSNTTPGGSWISTNPTIATAGSASGVVTGVSAGTSNITYKVTATTCIATAIATVNPLPAAISGVASVCIGGATLFANTVLGGTWSSSDTTIAKVNSSGYVMGIAAGTSTITYTLATGCIRTQVVTVNPLPSEITGVATTCPGSNTTLSDTVTGGTWSSDNLAVATIDAVTGVVTGVSPGTSLISYYLGTGCVKTKIVTVNPLPGAITGFGTGNLCSGTTITLSDATPAGTWSSSDVTLATVGSASGIVTGVSGGTVGISYTISTGCSRVVTINVIPTPTAIGGITNVCFGSGTTLSNTVSGGVWTSSTPAVAVIASASGIVTPTATGTTTITYTVGGTCKTTTVITVNPSIGTITGLLNACVGGTTTLNIITPGGTWVSGDATLATVGLTTGIVTGVAAGTVYITYTAPSGCMSAVPVIISPVPAPITGPAFVCLGNTTTLTSTTPGGIWNSSNTAVAWVTPGVGVVSGLGIGTTVISYTLGICTTELLVTVNASPLPITGNMATCVGASTLLADSIAGGKWTSGNSTIATVDSTTGLVTGVNIGMVNITYTVSGSCITLAIVTVNASVKSYITIHPSNALCSNTMYQNFGTPVPEPAGMQYIWSASNAVVYDVSLHKMNSIISFPASGTAVVKLSTKILSTGCIVTDSFVANIGPGASPTISVDYYGGYLVCSDNSADGYVWGYDEVGTLDSVKIIGQINQDYYLPVPDFANKSYWVITRHGACMQKSYYNRPAPAGISSHANDDAQLAIFPNPADTKINITVKGAKTSDQLEVKLYDMLGKNLLAQSLVDGKGSFDVASLPSGVYSVILFSNGGKLTSRTFVKN